MKKHISTDLIQGDYRIFEQQKFREQQNVIFDITARIAVPIWLIWILFDYYFAPQQYMDFMPVRIGGSVLSLALFLFNRRYPEWMNICNMLLILFTIFGVSFFINYVDAQALPVYYLGYCLIAIVSGMVLIFSEKELVILSVSIVFSMVLFGLIYQKHSVFSHFQQGGFLMMSVLTFSALGGIIRTRNLRKMIAQEYKLNELNHSLKEKNIQMENALSEREILLREIHHRVKNNLHIISSMLSLQVEHASSKTPAEVIRASQDRIISMALLHEKLYQSENFKSIDIKSYIESVAKHLHSSYIIHNPGIILRCDLQNKDFTIDTLVPLGLIVNELVTNSLKYGQSKTEQSVIEINGTLEDNNYQVSIMDNGPGFLQENALAKQSLGLKLVKGLAGQINAKLSHLNQNGSRFNLLIPVKETSIA